MGALTDRKRKGLESDDDDEEAERSPLQKRRRHVQKGASPQRRRRNSSPPGAVISKRRRDASPASVTPQRGQGTHSAQKSTPAPSVRSSRSSRGKADDCAVTNPESDDGDNSGEESDAHTKGGKGDGDDETFTVFEKQMSPAVFRANKRMFTAEMRKAIKAVSWTTGAHFARGDKMHALVADDEDVKSLHYVKKKSEILALAHELDKDVKNIQSWRHNAHIEDDKKEPMLEKLDNLKDLSTKMDETIAGLKEAFKERVDERAKVSRKQRNMCKKIEASFDAKVPPVLVSDFSETLCALASAEDETQDQC